MLILIPQRIKTTIFTSRNSLILNPALPIIHPAWLWWTSIRISQLKSSSWFLYCWREEYKIYFIYTMYRNLAVCFTRARFSEFLWAYFYRRRNLKVIGVFKQQDNNTREVINLLFHKMLSFPLCILAFSGYFTFFTIISIWYQSLSDCHNLVLVYSWKL